jgi:hypothetical protein
MSISLSGGLVAVDNLNTLPHHQIFTAANIFLWSILKNEVYAQKPRIIEQLKEKLLMLATKLLRIYVGRFANVW